MRARIRLLALAILLSLGAVGVGPQAQNASAQEEWQYHLTSANNFYRNNLYPKALAELKLVVADPEGAKQLKAWELIIEISGKLKELDTLIWALEQGRGLAKGEAAGQMGAQLYRLNRIYGKVVFEVPGGSGKLPNRGLELKFKGEISDPEIKSYYEKAVVLIGESGYAVGSITIPAGEYLLDGAPLKIAAGKETVLEVAPTAEVTLGIEIGGLGGGRFGEATSGAAGGVGGLQVLVGPHIRFASGTSLVVQGGPALFLGPQSTVDIEQDSFTNHSSARFSVGALALVGLEFKVGSVDLSPRFGYSVQYLASGIYYLGTVISSPPGKPSAILRGEFVVPAVAHGPRLGFQAVLGPSLNERGKRIPRVFVGVHGGPLWASPQWGDLGEPQGPVEPVPGVRLRSTVSDSDPVNDLKDGPFSFDGTQLDGDDRNGQVIFVDVQAVIGLQFRL